ncbi:hypothetical protein J6590_083404 [Homalodisca vitripennis]|nr:hypothetical protein J6590_083404 [Homalodisca vitripennis]
MKSWLVSVLFGIKVSSYKTEPCRFFSSSNITRGPIGKLSGSCAVYIVHSRPYQLCVKHCNVHTYADDPVQLSWPLREQTLISRA